MSIAFSCDFIIALGFTLVQAFVCWFFGSLIATSILVLSFDRPKFGSGFAGAATAIGLMPVILFPPTMSFISQHEWVVAGHAIQSLVLGLVTVAIIFPVYQQSSDTVRAARSRYADLAQIAGLGRWSRLRKIGWPSLSAQIIRSAAAAIPFSILLILLFEYGAGRGVGPYILGVLNSEGFYLRGIVVVGIALPCLLLRVLLIFLSNRMARRYGEERQKFDLDRAQNDVNSNGRWSFAIGFCIGSMLLLFAWTITFSQVGASPLKVWHILIDTTSNDNFRGALLADLFDAAFQTIRFAIFSSLIGVVFACVGALIGHRYKYFAILLEVLSVITQSVPIFLMISIYLMVLPSRESVFVLVGISVTFFFAYEIFVNQLRSQPEHWSALLRIGLPARHPKRAWRNLCYWQIPYLVRQGVVALALTAPAGVLAALVADIFLGMKGLANYGWTRAPNDLPVHMIVMTVAFLLMACSYMAASVVAPRLARDQ